MNLPAALIDLETGGQPPHGTRRATTEDLAEILRAEGLIVLERVDYEAAYAAKHVTVRQRINIAIGLDS